MILKCIAVDDEPLALQLICDYIGKTPYLQLVGSFTSSVEALKAVHREEVQVIFLDIRMPDLNGIELAKVLSQGSQNASLRVIFTTAFDHYAIEGYKVDALDYLLKPFNYIDFSRAANKAYAYFELLHNSGKPAKMQEPVIAEEEYLYVKVEYQLLKISLKDILYIESLRDYVKIFLVNEKEPVVSLMTMRSIEEKLTNKGFMRIHRSFMVSIDKIKSVTKTTVIINKATIPVTEQYKEIFNTFYNSWSDQSG